MAEKKTKPVQPKVVVLAHPTKPNTVALADEDGNVLEGYGYVNLHGYTAKQKTGKVEPHDRNKAVNCTTCGFVEDHPAHSTEPYSTEPADAEE